MSKARREAGVLALLGAGAYLLAFVQRPGWATADTKINLHVDPGRFLADVASMWTSTGQLGDVQAGQQAGYLFPMGPFFAAGHSLGLPDWVVQRLWLGTVLALAAIGAARLVRALMGPSATAQLTAGAVILLNPFVVTYADRTTVTFLAYAALPWLMLAVHRGVRDARGWRWPAAIALLVTASGGGINGAVTAWMLIGPGLLVFYEPLVAGIGWPQVRAFLVRTLPLTALVSVWWVVPAYVQSSWGIDFLHFTEQPGTVWGTTSATESLRLMSFWLSYVGIGFAGRAIPYFDDSRTMLFSAPVVVASLLLPAVALGGFVWTRRWRYGPFFLGLALVAVLIMGAGFPEGTPLRHGLNFAYNHFSFVQFLRASYKAAPLLALALACLGGAAAPELSARLAALGSALWWRGAAALAGAAILVLAAWPLVSGRAQDAQVSFRAVPAAWRDAAADLDRELPVNSRAMVLPGDLFSFYTWGGTVDPILPALATRPVAERAEVPYSDLRATDLLWTIDGLVHQQRLLPGQLEPLLSLIGVRSVVTGTDDDLARSDAPTPADAAATLSAQPGFARPTAVYGPVARFAPTGLGPTAALPEVRRYDLPPARGLVRVEPRAAPVVVDGSAAGIAELAAFGALPARRALLYAADLSPAQLRAELAHGGDLVITDSDRRQAFVSGTLEQNAGPVLTPDEDLSADGFILDPFGLDPDHETVADYSGVRSVQAPSSPQIAQFPEHAPFAAIDGSPTTAWLADPTLGAGDRWLQVDFDRARAVPDVDLLPYGDAGGVVRRVQIAGRTFAVHPGWNRLTLGLRAVTSLRVSLTDVTPPLPGATAGAGGISELRIPGIHAAEALRLPVDAARAASGWHGLDSVALTYLFQRTTGDDPFARDLAVTQPSARDVDQPGDAEQTMRRSFDLPAARRFAVSAWVQPFSQTPDDVLDRLAGYRGPVRATSSSRFDGEPRWRASSALTGAPGAAWIGDWDPAAGPAWLQISVSGRPFHVSALVLGVPSLPVRRPTVVRVQWPGGATARLAVSAAGAVTLPHPVATRELRIEILSAVAPAGATAAQRRAVGIASLHGLRDLPRVPAPGAGSFTAGCGSARVLVGSALVALRVHGSAGAFEAGTPLPALGCGAPVALGAGVQSLVVDPGPLAVDDLRLFSPAPVPLAYAAQTGRVADPGTAGRGFYDGVRVQVAGPSWLVLGEGYNRGWEAWCNGRTLGAPAPIDGYANGWRIGAGCARVRLAFGPNRLAEVGYATSGVGGAACVVVLVLTGWRRRRRLAAPPDAPATLPAVDETPRWPPARAVRAALPAAFVFGFIFGVIPGLVSAPAIAFVLWRGIGARTLTVAATGLLALVVPLLYLLHTGGDNGGNHFGYAMAHLGAHYVGVAALGLMGAALSRSLPRQPRPARRPARGAG
ncbi:MAG: alpha-(1-_3)-arabinofuranosyltransferase family protein [Solirubrobacteraceae bacterium]